MNGERIRAFVCFEIESELREYLAQIIQEGRRLNENISWARPETIHLTLKFLGNITPAQQRDISNILLSLAGTFEPFQVTIDRIGAFPNFRRPRVFWAGCSSGSPDLERMALRLDSDLEKLGFEREKRAFTAHLTLGRVKRGGAARTSSFLASFSFQPQVMQCREIILMKSDLHPTGAVYTPLETFTLKHHTD